MKHLLSAVVSALFILAVSGLPALADSRVQAASSAPLHARPDSSSPVLATSTPGEIFFADHDEGAWTAVAPPDRVALWIHSDFVEGTRVAAKSVQLRTAPSLSSDVAGSLSRGATILQRGKQGDWLQIAPPSSALVYIESSRLSPVVQRTEPVREIPEEPVYLSPSEPALAAPAPVTPPPAYAAPEPALPAPVAAPAAPPPTPAIAASVPGAAPRLPAPVTTYPASVPVPAASAEAPAVSPPAVSPAPDPALSLAIAPSVPSAPDTPSPAPAPAKRPAPSASPRPAASSRPAPARPATPPAEHVTPASELRRPLAEAHSGHTPAVAPSKPASAPPSTRPSPVTVDPALVEELNLVDTPNQGKAVQVEGELRLAPFTKGSPSRYRLLVHGPHTAQMLCHVHGRPADLRPYIGRTVSIRGKAFRVADSDMPVVVVGKLVPIDPDPDPDAEGFRF